MKKRNKSHLKRLRNLIAVFSTTTILMSVSTYAWFIGMRTVNVSSFDVEIAGTDSLLLSLNGGDWNNTVSISEETLSNLSYINNTNSWGGSGLVPMSSIGDIDTKSSKLKLFEKAGLTASGGGYRLLASQVDNYSIGKNEQDGYVAFDLFIKNFSGSQYIADLNDLDEEAIYLTTDSKVDVDIDGGGIADTGIENSVRVAFAQIGRVAGTTTDSSIITGITCNADSEGKPSLADDVTGICRTAKIWEPNDTKHVSNAINWYNTSCKKRISKTAYSTDEACLTVINGNSYPTYAIGAPIASSDSVDVYDGLEYNGYAANSLVKAVDYFTDSDKVKTGTNRPEFMTLAPNSITKVRVYVYIEGQDIDNFDFASIGKRISVKFGFTKERFTDEDVDYQGPDVTLPTITLNGDNPTVVALNGTYEELGATASDINGGQTTDLTENIIITGDVDTTKTGTYYITYSVLDAAKNTTSVTRTVVVK